MSFSGLPSSARRGRATAAAVRCRRLFVEQLERRQLLAGDYDWYNTPEPNWFQTAETQSLMANPRADSPASRWIVRLDADYSAALGDASHSWQAFYPTTVLAAG